MEQYKWLRVDIEIKGSNVRSIFILKIFKKEIIIVWIIYYLCHWFYIFINNIASLLTNMNRLCTQLLIPNNFIFSHYTYTLFTSYNYFVPWTPHTFNLQIPFPDPCTTDSLLFEPPVNIHQPILFPDHDYTYLPDYSKCSHLIHIFSIYSISICNHWT